MKLSDILIWTCVLSVISLLFSMNLAVFGMITPNQLGKMTMVCLNVGIISAVLGIITIKRDR